jgi:tryptophan-rich sensory protein
MKNKINFIAASLWILSFETISFFMGIISRGNRDWYQELLKSNFTPPGYVFSIIWPILYLLLAVIGYILWQKKRENKLLMSLFWIQMILNWSWSPIFFGWKLLGLSLLTLSINVIINYVMLYKSYINHKTMFYLMLPYFVWICFALYLNFILFILN